MKRSAECKPGYGCLKCKLPPFECDYSGQKVFPEEREMRKLADWNVLSVPHPNARKAKDHS